MTVAHGDPEEIEKLARHLESMSRGIKSKMDVLREMLEDADWDDDKFRMFAETFKENRGAMNNYMEDLEENLIPKIRQNAQALREYLKEP